MTKQQYINYIKGLPFEKAIKNIKARLDCIRSFDEAIDDIKYYVSGENKFDLCISKTILNFIINEEADFYFYDFSEFGFIRISSIKTNDDIINIVNQIY